MPCQAAGADQRSLNGVRLHVRRGGQGPQAVVLLHGWCGSSHSWRQLAPLLARDHTVIVPDMRGYGRSEKPPSAENGGGYVNRRPQVTSASLAKLIGQLADRRRDPVPIYTVAGFEQQPTRVITPVLVAAKAAAGRLPEEGAGVGERRALEGAKLRHLRRAFLRIVRRRRRWPELGGRGHEPWCPGAACGRAGLVPVYWPGVVGTVPVQR